MTTKNYTNFGVYLDADFRSHVGDCASCRSYDPTRPQTAALCCLEGSVLLKRQLAAEKAENATGAALAVLRDKRQDQVRDEIQGMMK